MLTSCSRAGDSNPQPPPRDPAPAVAPHPVDPLAPLTLALDGPAQSTPSDVNTNRFGILWRAPITGIDPGSDDTEGAIVIGNEVFVSTPSKIQVFDLATGAKLRSATIGHTGLVATHDALVARNDQEVFGLDKRTLRPTWHAPAPNYLGVVGEYVLETPPLTQPERLRLRRASDGSVMWENDERLSGSALTSPQLDGDTLYVPVHVGGHSARIAAIDVATGVVRWRAEGYVRSASSGHVVIQDGHAPPPTARILDATGRVRWRATGAWLELQRDIAYASTSEGITLIDLSTNRVRWRRTNVSAIGDHDKWLFGTSGSVLKIMDRATGEIVGEMQLGYRSGERLFRGPLVVRVGSWLFALGPRSAPEQRKPVVVRGCLIVMGCPGESSPAIGVKVTIDNTTVATTDRRGCFQTRATLGLGPARVDVASGTTTPLDLDNPFPEAVVFAGPPVTLRASNLGAGCHITEPGNLP